MNAVPDLAAVRSLLFLPASNPRAIARAREAGADMVILDLEDSVKPENKGEAREAALAAAAVPWPGPLAIRVNGAGTDWHSPDIDAAAQSKADFVVLPRSASSHLLGQVREATGKPVLAMIETASGVIAAPEIAQESAALIAGTNDLRAELGIATEGERGPIAMALQWIVLAARAAGIPAFDGVFNGLEDENGLAAEAQNGRALGFTGKSLIHPNQVEPTHSAFAPDAAEVAQALRLIDSYEGGAARFEGRMIERMHIESARRLVHRAQGRKP